MRVHLGCGAVYLREWVNVDLPLPTVFLAKERPDLVERFAAIETDYYGRHSDQTPEKWRKGPILQETCCDAFGAFALIPARPESVSAIWSVQVFEHLDRREAREGLAECRRVLKRGGLLKLDIPDADETLVQYGKTKDDFFIRHLLGPRRDVYGSHFHYSRSMLKQTVEAQGFSFVEQTGNIHSYPAIAMTFRKV